MVSKQKGIFDKEPVKVRLQKEQTKTEDEFVSFEDSFFALAKKGKAIVHIEPVVPKENFVSIEDTIFCQRSIYHEDNYEDNENTTLLSHDDEVPLEESIFARRKKKSSTVYKLPKENKIDLEELFEKYKDIYMNDYILNTKRLYMIDANVYNTCCMNLERSRHGAKIIDIDTYNLVKKVIKGVCTCTEDVFCCYVNMNTTLLHLISELNPEMDTFTMYSVLDKSYIEIIDELGGKVWQK